MSEFILEVTAGAMRGRRFALAPGAAAIGRSSQSAIAFDRADNAVSAHHAVVYLDQQTVSVQDLGSTNGTFVNGERIDGQREIRPGDEIGLGKTGPRMVLRDGVAAQPPQPLAEHDSGSHTRPERDAAPMLVPGSLTAEMEHALSRNQLGATSMLKLLGDRRRVASMLERDGLDDSQKGMLAVAYAAHARSARRWGWVMCAVAVAGIAVAAVFAVRAQMYRGQLARAQEVARVLDGYEQQVAQSGDSSAAASLLNRIDSTTRELETLRGGLRDADIPGVYQDSIAQALDRIVRSFGETNYHLPPAMVSRVRHHVELYSGRLHATVQRYLDRKPEYFPMIEQVFAERNLPPQLAYVSMLESGLTTDALSSAGALGLWQFMPGTARTYRLRVDSTVDERRDPRKATVAAAEYIRDLIGIFGGKASVMIAIAAYNAGEMRLMGALKRIDNPLVDRDFWHLYRMGYLPEETAEYIPRVLALMIIDSERTRYGMR